MWMRSWRFEHYSSPSRARVRRSRAPGNSLIRAGAHLHRAWIIGVCVQAGCVSQPTLETFRADDPPCYDRSVQPQTAVVDSHVHFRPFGGAAVPFAEMISYLEDAGVLFANVYGIGQTLPAASTCTYYLDCPGTRVTPTLKNDFVNAANVVAHRPQRVHLTLSMTFPDLSRPESILPGMQILDAEFPDVFRWMGEVNLVKQALFENGRDAVAIDVLPGWAAFMEALRDRDIPLAIHSDLGNDADPLRYLPHMEEVLRLYPDNAIVWVHMGLSRELADMDAGRHIRVMTSLLDRYPRLMLDISWRVIDDAYFSSPEKQPLYVAFFDEYSERILPGTDFLASSDKDFGVYREELRATSRILGELDDAAFRNIALGRNYFRLLGLDYDAPPVCTSP